MRTLPIIIGGMRIGAAVTKSWALVFVRQISGAMQYGSVHALPYRKFNGGILPIGYHSYRVN